MTVSPMAARAVIVLQRADRRAVVGPPHETEEKLDEHNLQSGPGGAAKEMTCRWTRQGCIISSVRSLLDQGEFLDGRSQRDGTSVRLKSGRVAGDFD